MKLAFFMSPLYMFQKVILIEWEEQVEKYAQFP